LLITTALALGERDREIFPIVLSMVPSSQENKDADSNNEGKSKNIVPRQGFSTNFTTLDPHTKRQGRIADSSSTGCNG
jgi:hypothetical protein